MKGTNQYNYFKLAYLLLKVDSWLCLSQVIWEFIVPCTKELYLSLSSLFLSLSPSLSLSLSAQPQAQSSTNSTVAIAVPVIIFVVLCFISLLSVLGCMVYCKRRHTFIPFQLQFQKMKDGDQDDLVTLDAMPENYEFEPDEVKSDLGNENSSSHNEDPDRYEKPAQLNTGTIV